MKFLCPSCKAKYQIADEKVAGRSVRMKCRKCGQEIRVSSADAVPSSTAPPPNIAPAPAPTDAAASPAATAAASPAATAAASAVATADKRAADAAKKGAADAAKKGAADAAKKSPAAPGVVQRAPATSPATRPDVSSAHRAKTAAVPVSAKSAAATPRPSGVNSALLAPRPPPRASGAGHSKPGVLSRPLVQGPVAVSVKANSPSVAEPKSQKEAPQARLFPESVQEEEFAEEEQTRIADLGALAGAFSAAVAGQPSHDVSDPLTMSGDEWFVGINGVPVGPIRLSELRSKAAAGSITKESLVWRDGFEEWRALKSFPELVAIVEESLSSARASFSPSAPPENKPRASLEPLSDPFAGTVPQPVVSSPAGAVTRAAVVTDDLDLAGFNPRPKTSMAAWIAMIVAVFFGISLGFVFFSQKPKEVVRYVEVPTKGEAPKAAGSVAVDDLILSEPKTPPESKPGAKGPLTATKAPAPKPGEPESKLTGGLRGLGAAVPGGPKSPTDNTGPSGGGGQLEASQVQSVVSRYTASVKRSCWQPALDTRDKDAPSSARVVVSLTVAGNGSVQTVSTSGDPKGYRGLANCIAGRVRGWQFPASGGSTPINVPFVFVAQ